MPDRIHHKSKITSPPGWILARKCQCTTAIMAK